NFSNALLKYSISICTFFRDHRDLHSFPTRRSSDLRPRGRSFEEVHQIGAHLEPLPLRSLRSGPLAHLEPALDQHGVALSQEAKRSEEHTSELQSRGHPVCRLLLEKKIRP